MQNSLIATGGQANIFLLQIANPQILGLIPMC
jgi:hypothetical protein